MQINFIMPYYVMNRDQRPLTKCLMGKIDLCVIALDFYKVRFSVFEIADMIEAGKFCDLRTVCDIRAEVGDFMSVRAYGDNFSANFPEHLYVFQRRERTSVALSDTGSIYFDTLSVFGESFQAVINNILIRREIGFYIVAYLHISAAVGEMT